jgi:cardiolipin synthase
MEKSSNVVNLRDIILPPNLVSVMRVLMTVPIGYFLAVGTQEAAFVCFGLLVLAGLTDILDGFLARRLNQITRLGLILDPLADKILVITLVIELVFFRDFPIWLAVAIMARDLAILTAGTMLVRKKGLIIPSNYSGKYYFCCLTVLLASYIIYFEFGKALFLYIVLLLFVLSAVSYAGIFRLAARGERIPEPRDSAAFRFGRAVIVLVIAAILVFKFYTDILSGFF